MKACFQTEYESDYLKWKKIPVKKINEAAAKMYKKSEETLQKDNKTAEII